MTVIAPPIFAVEHISFGFPGRKILDAVSFTLRPGTVTCLLGSNGAGKTTLLNIISGFLQPHSGAVLLGNTKLNGYPPYRISRFGVGRTFQDLRLIGKLSVRENLLLALPQSPSEHLRCALFPRRYHRQRDALDLRKTDAFLENYFLAQVADQLASEISFGQQKLLTLACCAAMDARLLLLDEPVAGISPEVREHIAERLADLKAAGKTILLIEHQPDFLERTGDAFLFLQTGKLHDFSTLAELCAAPVTHDAFV